MSIPTELPKPPDVTHPPHPGWAGALWRGFTNRCPCCGTRGLRAGFLRLRPRCDGCGLELGGFRADDAPPYFTILAVGHLVVPAMLMVERNWAPDLWLQAAIWLPTTLALTLLLLPPIKGAVVGCLWAAGIRG
jgi:uncharacterized protein (DUF983 family)